MGYLMIGLALILGVIGLGMAVTLIGTTATGGND
jgi:hypothetical protein